MRYALTGVVAVAALSVASAANAAVFIYDSPGVVQPEENVLLNTGETGMTITGLTNQTNTSVTFQSDELITAPSNGQARVEGADGSLDYLAFYLTDSSLGFTEFEFNPFFALEGTSTLNLTVNSGQVYTFDVGNGQNYLSGLATDGDFFTRIEFQTNGTGMTDARQFRLGGIAPAIPEPSTWAMMLFGFGAIGFSLRRRKQQFQTKRLRVAYQ